MVPGLNWIHKNNGLHKALFIHACCIAASLLKSDLFPSPERLCCCLVRIEYVVLCVMSMPEENIRM
jgi:energy-coupling factor transporter transmembrane protein EcfT